jgi:hypothetical protein
MSANRWRRALAAIERRQPHAAAQVIASELRRSADKTRSSSPGGIIFRCDARLDRAGLKVPGISTRIITDGNPDYLAWIRQETAPQA